MVSDELCFDCISLVGAGPRVDAHAHLKRAGAAEEELFQCSACEAWWTFGRLGWGRAVPD